MYSIDRKEHVKRLREKRASRHGMYMQMSKNRLQNRQWFETQQIDMHNSIRLLFAKLCFKIYSRSFFPLKVFLRNILPSFQNFKFYCCAFQKMVEKSNIEEKNYFDNCFSRNMYSFLKNFKFDSLLANFLTSYRNSKTRNTKNY